MAIATINQPVEATFTLELSQREAAVVYYLTGQVSGWPDSTWRGNADSIRDALDEWFMAPVGKCQPIAAEGKNVPVRRRA